MNTTTSRFRISRPILIYSALLSLVGAVVLSLVIAQYQLQYQYDQDRRLIEALKHKDIKQAIELVNAGADPNARLIPRQSRPLLREFLRPKPDHDYLIGDHVTTAFMMACGSWTPDPRVPHLGREATVPLIEAMLRHGAYRQARDEHEMTPLIWATVTGRTDIMAVLLDNQMPENEQNDHRHSALDFAVRLQNRQAVELLLQHNVTPERFQFSKELYSYPRPAQHIAMESQELLNQASTATWLGPHKSDREGVIDREIREREEATPVEQYLRMIEKSNKKTGDSRTRISRGL